MKTLYQSEIIQIGEFAQEALQDNMLITFKQGVPKDLADYCFVHTHSELRADMQVGDWVSFAEKNYIITALGDVANQNLRELGHVTWRFDGARVAEYPGSVHLQGEAPQKMPLNSTLSIKRDE